MFEAISPSARTIITQAMTEAQRCGHDLLLPGHLLFALLRPESVLSSAAAACGADLDVLRDTVGHLIVPSDDRTEGALRIPPDFKNILDEAAQQARSLGHELAGEEHLILGLLSAEDGTTTQVLAAVGIAPARLRREVLIRIGVAAAELSPTVGTAAPAGPLSAKELERIRLGLIDFVPLVRLKALDKARALDQTSRQNLVAACNITGQTTLSDEIVALLAENWASWPALTNLCLRGCSMLSTAGGAIISSQGNISELELAGVPVTANLLIELAKLPLRKLELWEGSNSSIRDPSHATADATPIASGAIALAHILTLTHLEWHNAPGDPAVTTALAASPALRSLSYTRKETEAALLAPLGVLEHLVELHVFSIDDAGLATIVGLPRLERLTVEHSPRVTDEGLAALRNCAQLRAFKFSGATVTPAGMMHLASLVSLEEIYLYSRDAVLLTNVVAAAFGAMPRLKNLTIRAPADLDDDGVADLTRASGLTDLWLDGCARVTDASMPYIARLTALETLCLSGTAIGDVGAAHIAGLVGLHELDLQRTAITPATLPALKPLTGLRILKATDCTGLVPMDIGSLLGMANLEELGLQRTGPLDAAQTRQLVQHCRKLRELRCGLIGPGALAPLTLLPGLRSLWITSADGVEDTEWGLVNSLRELWSLVIVDAPWLTDAGLEAIGRMPWLKAVGIAGCPGVTGAGANTLAKRLHLNCMSTAGRRVLARGGFIVLGGQLFYEGRGGFGRPRRSTPKTGMMEAIAALAPEALAPYRPPIDDGDVRRRLRDPDPEESAEGAVRDLEAIGGPDVVPVLAAALTIGPTRWAYAGWALVRLARAGLIDARAALQHAHDHGGTESERDHARRFLAMIAG